MAGNGSHIVRPSQDRTVALADVSKAQLAAALNEQSERFKVIREQLKIAVRVLSALVLEPEALHCADGRLTVDAGAIAKVKHGMVLHMDQADDASQMILTLDTPAATGGEGPPRIAIPRGVH